MLHLKSKINFSTSVTNRQILFGKIGLIIIWLLGLIITISPAQFSAWVGHRLLLVFISLAAFFLLYVVPGLAILRWLWNGFALSRAERAMFAVGIGTMVPPLLINICSIVNVPLNRWTTWIYALLALILWLYPRRATSKEVKEFLRKNNSISWHELLVILTFGMVIFSRFYTIRDIEIPLWGDSYHHTMITQLLSDNHGLFTNWLPYADLYSFTYHYGFHANAVFFHWLTGIASPQSVLITGQLMNIATVAIAYPLTTLLSKQRTAGLIAMILTGFVNVMPAYYVNWGRYTQLAGQVLLCVVLISWMHAIERETSSWRAIIFAIGATSALVLTHYIVTIFAIFFLLVYVLGITARNPQGGFMWRTIVTSTLIVLFSLVITSPWLINLFNGRLTSLAGSYISNQQKEFTNSQLFNVTPFFIKFYIVILALTGIWIAIAKRQWKIGILALWSILFIFLVIPHIINIPLSGIVTSFTSAIALYITLIPLASYAIAAIGEYVQRYAQRVIIVTSTIILFAVTLWGVKWQSSIIDTQFQLFTPADAQAMNWIRENTTPESTFLVNTLLAYNDSLIAGDDGGWWIPLLTGRRTMLPPLTYGAEKGATPSYLRDTTDFVKKLLADPLPSSNAIELLQRANIKYIYIGPHMGSDTQKYRINTQALRYLPQQFPIVYERDGVIIFEIKSTS